MKTAINQVVLQIIKSCDQACPHCFFNSYPSAKQKLTLFQIKSGLNDLKKTEIKKVNKFIISGGEPFVHPQIISIVKIIRIIFPFSKIRIDTNGLKLFETPFLFRLIRADIYNISIDPFHNQGVLKKEKKFQEIFIKKDGSSKLVDFFLKQKKKYKFKLNIRWTSNGEDEKLFKSFIKKYKNEDVIISRKLVTATGRAKKLSSIIKGSSYLIKEKPSNFKCLIGNSLLLSVGGYWYGCYHPVSFTRLSLPGQSSQFALKLRKILNSNLAKKLSQKGILEVLTMMKKKNPKLRFTINSILKNKYSYRCQPCEAACAKKIFNFKNGLIV